MNDQVGDIMVRLHRETAERMRREGTAPGPWNRRRFRTRIYRKETRIVRCPRSGRPIERKSGECWKNKERGNLYWSRGTGSSGFIARNEKRLLKVIGYFRSRHSWFTRCNSASRCSASRFVNAAVNSTIKAAELSLTALVNVGSPRAHDLLAAGSTLPPGIWLPAGH